MPETLVYSHPDCLQHEPGYGHPESPRRLQAILENIDHYETAPLGTEEQVLLAHHPDFLEQIRQIAPAEGLVQIDADTLMSASSLSAALRGTGAACQGIDDLLTDKARHVFSACRPPGHHATASQAMGFCLFNHIAIAALYAQNKYGINRIAIMDFDVHHGNGTQDIVLNKPGLFYISTHQSPFYPGTGSKADNIPDNILNIPLPAGTGHSTYQDIFKEQVLSSLEAYKPELLLVSAGFDAHHEDPLAAFDLTDTTYQWIGEQLGFIARQHCRSRLLSVLEGGYNIAVLPASVKAYLHGIEKSL